MLQDLRPDISSVITASLSAMDEPLKKVYEIIGGLPQYNSAQQVCKMSSCEKLIASMLCTCADL